MKPVKPSQLELVPSPDNSDIDASLDHFDAKHEANGAALLGVIPPDNPQVKAPEPDRDPENVDWDADDSVILKEQRATAAYRNRAGELVIRQRASWDEEQDTFLFITPENETTFMEALARRARE